MGSGKHRDLFGLGARLFGVWMICRSLPYLATFVDAKLYPSGEKAQAGAAAFLIYPILDLGFAAFLLLWTKVLVAWTYGDEVEGQGTPEA